MHLAGFVKRTLHLTCCVFRAFWRDRRCLSSSTHFSFFPSLCAKASPLFCSMLSTGILNTIGFKISPLATELSVGLQVPFCNCKQRFYRKIGEKKRNHLTFWCFKALHPPFTHRKETSCPSALTPGAGLSLAELPPCTCPLLVGLVTPSFPSSSLLHLSGSLKVESGAQHITWERHKDKCSQPQYSFSMSVRLSCSFSGFTAAVILRNHKSRCPCPG